MLRSFLEQPLIDMEEINARLDAVEEINGHEMDREEIREYLGPVYDLERLMSRVSYQSANPRAVSYTHLDVYKRQEKIGRYYI